MGRQQLAEKAEFEKAVGLRPGFKGVLFSLVKLVLSVVLVPLVIGFTKGFIYQLDRQGSYIQNNFVLAIATYLILHIFVCEPKGIYDFGQRIVGFLFNFLVPLRKVMYYCLPFFAVLFFALYFTLNYFFDFTDITGYAVFIISFSVTMHLAITAAYLKTEQSGVLKGDYFFYLFLVYLAVVALTAALLNFILRDFSFIDVIKDGYKFFVDMIVLFWRQLFVVR
jgi:hypothetical protein